MAKCIRYIYAILAYILLVFVRTDRNKYLMTSMSGNSYGGNPRAFSDYLHMHFPKMKQVWAFADDSFKVDKKIGNSVRLYTFSYYWHLYTSANIISDQRLYKPMYPWKRKGQYYVQTWHGTALKRIEADIPQVSKEYVKNAIRDSLKSDLYISGSDYMSKLFKKSFWYSGEILTAGTPRNDVFFDAHEMLLRKEKVFEALGISPHKKVLLYAPTFRANSSFEAYGIDTKRVSNTLNKAMGGNWVLLIRLHPNLVKNKKQSEWEILFPSTINVTSYPDIQDLLCAANILVTDYSSCMFDYMYTLRPCIIFAEDIGNYDRGFYMSVNSLPFPVANNNSELEKAIKNFDENTYKANISDFVSKIGSVENGEACKTLYKHIQNRWEQK